MSHTTGQGAQPPMLRPWFRTLQYSAVAPCTCYAECTSYLHVKGIEGFEFTYDYPSRRHEAKLAGNRPEVR